MKKIYKAISVVFLAYFVSSCGMSIYIPDSISSMNTKDLCKIYIDHGWAERKIDDQILSGGGRGQTVYLKPGTHTLSGYLYYIINKGDQETTLQGSLEQPLSLKQSEMQNPSLLDTMPNLKFLTVYKNPKDNTIILTNRIRYKIKFQCEAAARPIRLSEIIMRADQLIEQFYKSQ